MESGSGSREVESGVLAEMGVDFLDFLEGGAFGFVGDGDSGEMEIGREMLLTTLFEEVGGKLVVIGGEAMDNGGVVGLVGLDDSFGGGEMAATDPPDDLGEELKSAFFGGEIGKREPGISLDDTDGGEIGKV